MSTLYASFFSSWDRRQSICVPALHIRIGRFTYPSTGILKFLLHFQCQMLLYFEDVTSCIDLSGKQILTCLSVVFYGIITENEESPILLKMLCCKNMSLIFYFLNGSAFFTSVKFCGPDLSHNGLIVGIKSQIMPFIIPVKEAVLCAR